MTAPTLVSATRRPADEALLRTGAPSLDVSVRAPATIVDAATGSPVLVTAPFPADLASYRRALRNYPQSTVYRTSGFRTESAVFGYVARNNLMQRSSCRACAGADAAPGAHQVICDAAGPLAALLARLAPERAATDLALVAGRVSEEWRLTPDAPWTSGVVNRTSPLPYHRDARNFDAWSAMVVTRRGVRGGHLHVPEYGLVVDCRDGDVVYFNGSDLMHGVTPMRKVTPDGYRMSAVYYSIRVMASCLPFAEEIERGRRDRSDGETSQLERQRAIGKLR